jgi:hypothetical protein
MTIQLTYEFPRKRIYVTLLTSMAANMCLSDDLFDGSILQVRQDLAVGASAKLE